MKPAAIALVLFLGFVPPALAQQPPHPFQLPVDCNMEEVCSVQIYVDMAPSEGDVSDYACGRLSYDGSTGTDFRVRNLADMARGIPVLSAAPGVVVGVRDGMDDVSVREIGLESLGGRFSGNAVGIDHGDGWTAQYSHLRKGSVLVKKGDRVAAGTPLGLIGLSGNTDIPHLDFEVRYQGRPVDPFVGPIEEFYCSVPRQPLWSAEALASLAYRPAWLVDAGFADEAVATDKIKSGTYRQTELASDAPVITFWVHYANALGSDRYELTITAPDGVVVHRSLGQVEKSQHNHYAFAGRRQPDGGWPAGTYRGKFGLFRGGRLILSAERDLTVR